MSTFVPSQAYELKLAPHPAPFSVLKFTGSDQVSQLYRYEIEFTSPHAGIPMDSVLGRPARFSIDPISPGTNWRALAQAPVNGASNAYTIHGIITQFDEFETSADQTRYRVVLEPRLADLNRAVSSRLFQKQTLEEIVTAMLRHEGYAAGVDFVFKLRDQNYKRREYVTQYRETSIAFIQRLCAQEGVWFRFEQQKDRAVVVFGDDMQAYARKRRGLPYRPDSGLESSGTEAITTLHKRTCRVPEAVRLQEYNHRAADTPLLVEQSAGSDDATTHAVDYHWGEHYETPEEGDRLARIRHEAHLARQLTLSGTGNPFWLEAGEVLRVEPAPSDAPHGIFVTSVKSRGSRTEAFWIEFEGIPSNRMWRTHLDAIERPVVDGILPAHVVSPNNYQYAYLDEHGRYVVKLPFDLDPWSPGGTSRPVRMAKPYSGGKYGHHFPLIDGAEVALIFTNGDPDRPIIVGAMHNSEQPDLVTNENKTRNLIVTAAGNVQRMEDLQGSEHIHLSTPYQASELNLGHMVNSDHAKRGQGAELRTDGHLAARGPKGMLLTTEAQPGASGHQLDMASAREQLQRAIERMESLGEAVQAAETTLAELKQQKALYADTLDGLKRSAILMSSTSGIGLTSGEHLQLNADRTIFATAGGNVDVGTMRNFTVAAGRQVALFAQAQGMRFVAAKQDVTMQARTGAINLSASKDVYVSSVDGEFVAASHGALTLTSGGAYIKIDGGNIELGCPGDITLKCGNFHWSGPGNLSVDLPAMPIGPCKECLLDAHRGVEAMTEVS
ncbi:type VI secretion system Vgr family protein [Pandoraea sp. NPDC087047]|uniref:type VI secretion system Vgr family protein n=1 Tax=Pandoraea sp. NPDC087047 TaxID=3364390 RepID=UPI00381A852D